MEDNLSKFTKNIHKNNIGNILLRGLGIILGLILVRVNISYLDTVVYGLWVTVASISQWANYGDLGVSNGLRNELTKAIAEENYSRQKDLIYTAIVMLVKISFCLFLLLTIITETLFTLGIMENFLRGPMYITNGFFCISFVFGISRTVAYSYQKSWYASLAQTSTVVIQIVGVLLLGTISIQPNLIVFASVSGLATVLGNLIIIVGIAKMLTRRVPVKTPCRYDKSYRNAIMNVGLQFFVLQICSLILYATDNVIINKLFSSEYVTKYSIISSIYNTGDSLFSLLLISLWSAVTYTATKGEYDWIKRETVHILKLWIGYCLGVVVVSLLLNIIIKIWLDNSAIYYEPDLIFMFAVYTIATTFGAIYVNVTNGLGRIKLQMICSVIGSIINIPLSVFLAVTCDLGLVGIKLATLLCCYGSIVLVPIDVIKLLNTKTKMI